MDGSRLRIPTAKGSGEQKFAMSLSWTGKNCVLDFRVCASDTFALHDLSPAARVGLTSHQAKPTLCH
jgi:hypothetical protein